MFYCSLQYHSCYYECVMQVQKYYGRNFNISYVLSGNCVVHLTRKIAEICCVSQKPEDDERSDQCELLKQCCVCRKRLKELQGRLRRSGMSLPVDWCLLLQGHVVQGLPTQRGFRGELRRHLHSWDNQIVVVVSSFTLILKPRLQCSCTC